MLLYGARKLVSLNKHRFSIVEKTYQQKSNVKYPFERLKSIAGSSIPPCETELLPHIDRSSFVARMWGSAHLQHLDKTPTSGWENINGKLNIIWFNGEQMPPALMPENQVQNRSDENGGDAQDDDTQDDDEDCDLLSREIESSDSDDDDQERDELL